MAYTLFDATLDLARKVGNVFADQTNQLGTTITALAQTFAQPADYWNGGTIWFSGANAGRYRVITDYLSGAFTFSALPEVVASGTAIWVLRGDWPVGKLVDFLNTALDELGALPEVDTSLVTVADQESYTLPAGVVNVLQVDVSRPDATPAEYIPSMAWRELDGALYFDSGARPDVSGLTIRLTYLAPHAELTSDTQEISPYIDPGRLTWAAAVHAWRWRLQMAKGDEPTYKQYFEEAVARSEAERVRHPIRRPMKAPRLSL